jgi:diadenosine tetraphosphate (Ap4A) HIT family hydrolase
MTADSSNSSMKSACGICSLIDRIKAGSFRDFVAELESCYVILGDQQFYRGYCVLFAKLHATELYLMPADAARLLSDEMRLVAEAIATVVQPWKMNYECLGNSEPHVHWHLLPRQANEPDELRRAPIWLRPESERKVPLDENDRRALIASIRRQLAVRFPDARIPSS